MRPFTKAVFEKEGKGIVGPRWTQEQVQQAYEIADELLNTIAHLRKDDNVKRIGLMNTPAHLFRTDLRNDLINLPGTEDVQKLGLSVLSHLLERGLDVAATANEMYNTFPNTFKARCASSKQAFSKDKFFRQKIPVSSFEAFRTQENPAICQDEKFSRSYADLYMFPLTDKLSRGVILASIGMLSISGASSAKGLFNETRWIQQQLNHEDLFRSPLDRSDLQAVVASRMAKSKN